MGTASTATGSRKSSSTAARAVSPWAQCIATCRTAVSVVNDSRLHRTLVYESSSPRVCQMTIDEIIEGVIDREGEGEPPYLVAGDRGGRTRWGISEKYHPEAWANGPPSREDAQRIYRQEYVEPWAGVFYPALKVQLIDWTVLHGLARTKYYLQKTFGTSEPIDLNRMTNLLNTHNIGARVMNNAMVAARLQLIDKLTDQEKSQKKFEEGWENRALHFMVLE